MSSLEADAQGASSQLCPELDGFQRLEIDTQDSIDKVHLHPNHGFDFNGNSWLLKTSASTQVSAGSTAALTPLASRLLRVFNIPRTIDPLLFTEFCKNFGEIYAVNQSKVESLGYAYVAYYDLRHAALAFTGLPQLQWNDARIRVEYVQPDEFQRVSLNSGMENIALCERSKVAITATADIGSSWSLDMVTARASEFGHIRTIERISHPSQRGVETIVCQYHDIRAASRFVAAYSYGGAGQIDAQVIFYEDPKQVFDTWRSDKSALSTMSGSSSVLSAASTGLTTLGASTTPRGFHKSLLTDATTSVEESLKHGSLDLGSRLTESEMNSKMDKELGVITRADLPKNNVVDLRRIAKGLDTRTTLMLRNIPNKVDQQMLKEYIDLTNAKTYDFLYLRIDFANKCNVGYAFISFIAPEHIITFAKARAGTKWNRFNSEKICDLSYANIYGKECLIEKFRNSSVMDQDRAYRPRIYHSEGDNIGMEQEFPEPNNLNRKLRSMVSVQRVGLFPPHDPRSITWKKK